MVVDNRPLSVDYQIRGAPYYVLIAVINYLYAKRHGYDFLYVQVDSDDLIDQVKRHYGVWGESSEIDHLMSTIEEQSHDESKVRQRISVFNKRNRKFLSSRWALLPAVAALLRSVRISSIESPYDYIMVLESDIFFTPSFHKRSIYSVLSHYASRVLTRGVYNASMIGLSEAAFIVDARNNKSENLLLDWFLDGNPAPAPSLSLYGSTTKNNSLYDDSRLSLKTHSEVTRSLLL